MDNQGSAMQARIKSPVVWTAVVAQLITVAVTLGWIDVGQSEAVNSLMAAVMQILVVFGVLNNPTDKAGF